jgi:hypothetical protein
MWGSVIFGLTSIVAVGLVSGMDPRGSWRLAQHRREAPGVVVAERDTDYEENNSTMRRHDYTFRLPDGTELRGHSYSAGHQYLNLPIVASDPNPQRWARVMIEYDPEHPEINRIKGTRTHLVSHWVLFVLIFPIIALLVALIGFASGWCQIALLRNGKLSQATLTAGRNPMDTESETDLPIADCRRLLVKKVECDARGVRSPFAFAWNGITGAWCLAVMLMIGAGVLFMLFGIVRVCQGDESFSVNGQPVRGVEGAWRMAGFLILWVSVGGVMLGLGRRLRFTPKRVSPVVDCAFEFPLPDGQLIRTRNSIPASVLASSEPLLPALYNPKWPQQATLLATVLPSLRMSPKGEWQAPLDPWSVPRLALAILALIVGPVLGAILSVS